MQLELETYMPQEAEEITGVTQATVRNWRRAGYLERPKGHARYNIGALLVQLVANTIVQRGVTPKAALTFARESAEAIFQSMLHDQSTYEQSAYDQLLQQSLTKVDSDPEKLAELRETTKIETDEARDILAKIGVYGEAAREFGISGIKRPEWLVIWADDNIEFLYDQDVDGESADGQFFGNIDHSKAYVQGPVILLCLSALGQMILSRLPRPPVKLSEEASA
jgi:hypothetical protein